MSGNLNFLLGFVAGLCIIGGLAPVRNPAGHPPAAAEDQRVVRGSCPQGQTLEAEEEFERVGSQSSRSVPATLQLSHLAEASINLPPSCRAPPPISSALKVG